MFYIEVEIQGREENEWYLSEFKRVKGEWKLGCMFVMSRYR